MPNMMEEKETSYRLKNANASLVDAFSRMYISVAIVYLQDGHAVVVRSLMDEEIVGIEMPWETVLKRYTERRAFMSDQEVVWHKLSVHSLAGLLNADSNELSFEIRCLSDGKDTLEWVRIHASLIDADQQVILVTTKNVHEQKFLRSIVDRFVYQNVDYFILLDMNRNCYTTFSEKSRHFPAPQIQSDDYTAEMIRYNKQYIVAGDMERVIARMRIENIRAELQTQDEFSITCGTVADDGVYYHSKIQFISFDRACGLVIVTRENITKIYLEEKRRSEQLFGALRQAQLDLLTNLYNQKTTADIITNMLTNYQDESAALLFIDIDNFKYVNDTLGHLRGDSLLQYCAAALKSVAGDRAVLGRIGGDEFLIYLKNSESLEEVRATAQSICGIFSALPDPEIQRLAVSCSVGVSLYPQDGAGYTELVRKADEALYRSKRYGKNRYSFYTQHLDEPEEAAELRSGAAGVGVRNSF